MELVLCFSQAKINKSVDFFFFLIVDLTKAWKIKLIFC